ncbi:hypothetical protein LSUE1_G000423 [Lachnellula suecica]|uniref:CFEM domain-containing protein n=1 Tax=Lachnellula suecica TaxID=602035 RepID=A0A8T9CLU5_9HELO|nr:hypothetical protein LSUE1_G000423 [Lachnellula suecica]
MPSSNLPPRHSDPHALLPISHTSTIHCISQSADENCSASDIKCLCRASAGNFLPDLITCMHGNCDNDLDNNLLLTPLQLVCQIAGTPIPDSALRNAENQASSLAGQVTTTVTLGGGSSASGSAGATTETQSAQTDTAMSVSTATVTTTQGSSTFALVFPVTIEQTTTISGSPSTVNSTPTSLSSLSSTSSTSTSSSGSSTSALTTSVAAVSTSSSAEKPSKTTSAPNEDETNSSPFKDTNSEGRRNGAGSWLGVSVGAVVGLFGMWV